MGGISYSQIGDMLKVLMNDTILGNDGKYRLIASDFGIDMDESDSLDTKEFVRIYNSNTEAELYRFYLNKSGLHCIDEKGNFIYSEVSDVLKYDVVDAFVGGGGGRREDGVYALIKLLEFKFNTTFGFPRKKCSWQGIYSCDCTDQSLAWVIYLEDNNLIIKKDSEPESISY